MIIGVSGYGFTGSGAVLDILKEYNQFEIIDDFEFSFIYKPDGIENLEHYLVNSPSRYFGCDTAIRRFINFSDRMKRNYDKYSHGMFSVLSKQYINSLIQTTWKGTCSFHSVECGKLTYYIKYNILKRIRYNIEKRFGVINGSHYPDIEMYMSIQPESFLDKTRQFISDLICSLMQNKELIPVLDQPFSADNPEKSFRYFDDPYAIVVDKDPRDLYLLAKTSLGMRGRFIPSDDVKQFIEYYKAIMLYRDKCIKNSDRVLYLHFEDLIYAHRETRVRIEQFLGIVGSRGEKRVFYPEKSINNTQLFRKYPEYSSDIDMIERELSEWIYDFSRYQLVPTFVEKSF